MQISAGCYEPKSVHGGVDEGVNICHYEGRSFAGRTRPVLNFGRVAVRCHCQHAQFLTQRLGVAC